jgi:hypothetical protein
MGVLGIFDCPKAQGSVYQEEQQARAQLQSIRSRDPTWGLGP